MKRVLYLLVMALLYNTVCLLGMKVGGEIVYYVNKGYANRDSFLTSLHYREYPYQFLDQACDRDDEEAVKILLQRNDIDLDAPLAGFEPALVCAARRNNTGIMQLLLDAGADPNIQSDGESCLHHACHTKSFAAVDLLLQQDTIEPNVRNYAAYVPLLVVAKYVKSLDLLNALLNSNKVDWKRKDRYNQSFFYVAFTNDVFSDVQQLDFWRDLNKKAQQRFLQDQLHDVSTHLKDSDYYIHHLFRFLSFCAENGADFMKKNAEGKTPFAAVHEEYLRIEQGLNENSPKRLLKEDICYTMLFFTPIISDAPLSVAKNIITFLFTNKEIEEETKHAFFNKCNHAQKQALMDEIAWVLGITETLYGPCH